MISPVEAIWTATEIFWTEKLIHVRAAHVVRSYSLELSLFCRSSVRALRSAMTSGEKPPKVSKSKHQTSHPSAAALVYCPAVSGT